MTEKLPDDDGPRTGPPLLSGFSVEHLYGRYSYDVKVPQAGGVPGSLVLLHGDNGCGKTTLLRLLWHTLSPATDRGHRGDLAKIPFSSFSVTLTDHSQITIKKLEGLIGSFEYIVEQVGSEKFSHVFQADISGRIDSGRSDFAFELNQVLVSGWSQRVGDSVRDLAVRDFADLSQKSQDKLRIYKFIESLDIHPLFLADDRRLYIDDAELDKLRDAYDREKRGVLTPGSNDVVADELRIALRRVNDWLGTLALRGQNTGSAGANSIYRDVLQQLASTGQGPAQVESSGAEATSAEQLLADLRVRSPRFEQYDLVPQFDAAEFEGLLRRVEGGTHQQLAHDIIVPYLNSLSARCDALEEAEQRITTLLQAANEFLIDKQLTFSARKRDSLRIVTNSGDPLEPRQLSSGERQLVMLLCSTLLAGRDARLFLIDEPELSLGVAWQRKVLDSLLSLTEGSSLQFVVATHSIEVLSTQLDSLVPLGR